MQLLFGIIGLLRIVWELFWNLVTNRTKRGVILWSVQSQDVPTETSRDLSRWAKLHTSDWSPDTRLSVGLHEHFVTPMSNKVNHGAIAQGQYGDIIKLYKKLESLGYQLILTSGELPDICVSHMRTVFDRTPGTWSTGDPDVFFDFSRSMIYLNLDTNPLDPNMKRPPGDIYDIFRHNRWSVIKQTV